MTWDQRLRILGSAAAVAGLVIAGMVATSPRGRADDRDDREDDNDPRIEQGFDIAPVPLELEGHNRKLVGLGSYLVNTIGCNDCHDTGPRKQYAKDGNPFFGQPKVVNPETYLGGGRDFGELANPPIGSAHIISRNLTPDKSGLPEGGNTYEQFKEILTKGTDFDHLHPTCTGAPNTGCIPAKFHGDLLQIMPWPNFKDLTDHEMRAIYEYLKVIPCIQGNYPGPGGAFANIPPEPAGRCEKED